MHGGDREHKTRFSHQSKGINCVATRLSASKMSHVAHSTFVMWINRCSPNFGSSITQMPVTTTAMKSCYIKLELSVDETPSRFKTASGYASVWLAVLVIGPCWATVGQFRKNAAALRQCNQNDRRCSCPINVPFAANCPLIATAGIPKLLESAKQGEHFQICCQAGSSGATALFARARIVSGPGQPLRSGLGYARRSSSSIGSFSTDL
jgi:hypothetical protein